MPELPRWEPSPGVVRGQRRRGGEGSNQDGGRARAPCWHAGQPGGGVRSLHLHLPHNGVMGLNAVLRLVIVGPHEGPLVGDAPVAQVLAQARPPQRGEAWVNIE